jgi:hypothetical protein
MISRRPFAYSSTMRRASSEREGLGLGGSLFRLSLSVLVIARGLSHGPMVRR